MEKETIYLITTRNRHKYYVVSESPDKAFDKLKEHLEEEYGITQWTDLGSVEVIAEKEWENVFEPIKYR